MAEPNRNETIINSVGKVQEAIATLRKEVKSKFNNREMAIVVTKLQEAEMWCDAYKQTLKD